MSTQQPPKPASPPGSIDFEETDFDSARQALDELPPALRPHATCEQFPRVVNAIAEAWADSTQGLKVIDNMINDYRGRRRGFPEAIQRELTALHAYRRSQQAG